MTAPIERLGDLVTPQGIDPDGPLSPDGQFVRSGVSTVSHEEGLRLVAILNTHGHADHIAGNAALKEAHPEAPLIIGAGDAVMLSDPEANLSAGFGIPLLSPPADRTVVEGDRLELAGLAFEVREIPGHSPGSVVFEAIARTSS